MLRGHLPARLLDRVALVVTQPPHEVAGVDEHRAGRRAHPVNRAGVDAVVVVFASQFGDERVVPAQLGGGELAPQHDALPGRQGQILARAHRLAVAALDAAVHLHLDRRRDLEVRDVRGGVLVEQHARVQQAERVDEPLDLLHDLEQLVAVLPPHERSHDPASAMLRLERAVVTQHELDHVLGEGDVAVEFRGIPEVLVEHEVDVAVLGVPEDDAVLVAVAVEQLHQPGAGVEQRRNGHRDVFEQGRRPRRPAARDGRVETLADVPERGARAGIRAQLGGCRQLQAPQQWGARAHPFGQFARGLGLVLDEQGCLGRDVQREQGVDGLRIALGDSQ